MSGLPATGQYRRGRAHDGFRDTGRIGGAGITGSKVTGVSRDRRQTAGGGRPPARRIAILALCASAGIRLRSMGVHAFLSLQELELRDVRFDVEIPAGEIDFDGDIKQSSPLRAR